MTNFTIVTDAAGSLIAAVHGHEMTTTKDGITSGVSFAKGHQLHKVELEDSAFDVSDPAAFHETILKLIPRK